MDKKKISHITLGIVIGGVLALVAGVYADQQIGSKNLFFGWCKPRFESGAVANFESKFKKVVANTASGAEIILTTTDSGALAKLEKMVEFSKNAPADAPVKMVVTKIDGGVKVSMTGTDADSIKRIQDMAANGKGIMPFGGRGFGEGHRSRFDR